MKFNLLSLVFALSSGGLLLSNASVQASEVSSPSVSVESIAEPRVEPIAIPLAEPQPIAQTAVQNSVPTTVKAFLQTSERSTAKTLVESLPAEEFSIAQTPKAAPDLSDESEDEEVVVRGKRKPTKTPYQPPDSSLGTRTNTPVLNIPQSVQVVPKQVIEDRGVRNLTETFRNVSGVQSGRVSPDAGAFSPVIRGFQSENVLRNGLRDETARFSSDTANIERVEFLKGPASVLFGRGDLAGTVNLVTKQPLDKPFYSINYQVGQFGVSRPSIDLTGPLTKDGVAYRVNASWGRSDSFKPFENSESFLVAPVLRIISNDKTKLTFELEYLRSKSSGNAPDLPADGTIIPIAGSQIRLNSNLGDPALSRSESTVTRLGYQFEHKFNPNLTFRQEFLTSNLDVPENTNYTNLGYRERAPRPLRRLQLGLTVNPSSESSLNLNQSLTGTFKTGKIEHQALIGFEVTQQKSIDVIDIRVLPRTIDILNIVTTPQDGSLARSVFQQDTLTERKGWGLYVQNQITFSPQFIAVIGGRFDQSKQEFTDRIDPTENLERSDSVFSPRLGLVYKPVKNVSIYGSYSQSFKPVIGRTRNFDAITRILTEGDPFKPETGMQLELGVKANFLNDRISATLAYYDLTRRNVTTSGASATDTFSQIQIGEQRSKGVELDVGGQLLPGWNVIASYAYADAQITGDNRFAKGNRLVNVPAHSYSLWTTYQLQSGGLKGFGVGFGVYGQGERKGDLQNSFTLPSYVRADASVFYRKAGWRAALNFQNLFGTEYYEGARDRNRVIPGAPFSMTGTVGVEF